MLIDVIKLKIEKDYVLIITFENGVTKLFDFKPLLDEKPFHKIKDPKIFNLAKIQYGTVVWPKNVDISPEYLYENGTQWDGRPRLGAKPERKLNSMKQKGGST